MNLSSSHKQVWRLAGPLIISNVSIAMLGMVDTAVVGHLAEPFYLGAVAVGAVIFDFLYWGMGFLRMGTTGIIAQAHGGGDTAQLRTKLVHAMALALIIALLILILQTPIIKIALLLIGGSRDVQAYATSYFYWAIWGAPAVLMSMAAMGWLLGMQNARATLLISVTVNVINIILDFIFVFGLEMDVRGVALASVLAQYTGLLLALTLIYRELKFHPGRWQLHKVMDKSGLRDMIILNQHIFIRTLCLIFAFAFFTRQGARQGDLVLAANAILLNFQMLLALGLDGFANAAEALTGKAIGAGDRYFFSESVKAAGIWSFIIALVYTLFYAAGGVPIINLMTSLPDVRALARAFLPWLVISPLISVWCFLLDGIFIGATRGKEMRNTMVLSTFLVFIPAWYVLQFLGNHGLWFAFMCFFAARGFSLGLAYYRIEKTGSGFVANHQSVM